MENEATVVRGSTIASGSGDPRKLPGAVAGD
jgi:hypothetical protein